MRDTCRALLATDDRLLEADERLAALNEAAGGGEQLVLPAVLALARLSRRLGVPISRPVLIADGDGDWDVWLRAVPDTLGVRLTLAEWVRRPAAARHREGLTRERAQEPLLTVGFAEPLHRTLDRPLSRIVATAESLRAADGGQVPEPYFDYAFDIAEAGRHLQALLGDVVDLDQLERALPVAREPVSLPLVARRAAALISLRASERDVTVRLQGGEAWALANERRVLQVVVNLLSNAVAHSRAGDMIVMTAYLRGEKAALTVSDQGSGITPADQERIFDKFVRLTSGGSPGSGLGLYISRRLARTMDGELTVESEAGQGARFTLTLPAA